MLDFMIIATRPTKNGYSEVYPKFIIKKSSDLMIRGGDFYAIWVEELGLWSTNEQDAIDMIDSAIDAYVDENQDKNGIRLKALHMWDSESGLIDSWHRYCQKHMRDSFKMLDEKLIFSNTETKKKDHASKKLPYPLEEGGIEAYNKLMSTIYSAEERHKIEWAIGSIVSGESKKIQKFMVLYGAAGTGKSTILNIIQQLFEGYYAVFDAKALGSASNSFALEAFKSNPLVAIQHDGDLSKIEDNTRLNSLVSHELMTVNEKFKATYSNNFKCFLFMGTNKPVKITDGKSGLIRRLIDVSPSGNKLGAREYKQIMKQVTFELGAIAYHCQQVYLDNPGAYDDYIPTTMMSASNDFYNFIIDSYHVFKKEDGTTLKAAWEMYKTYCDEAKVAYPFSRRSFKEELKNYFWEYEDRINFDDGSRVRSYYSGFRTDKFEEETKPKKVETKPKLISLDCAESIFDKECADCPAQYATANETPSKKWEKVTSKLSKLDTSKLHFVKVPENHIVIDFDIRDRSGNKLIERNLEEASKWPATYTEVSKSGGGIHLHYIYTGDVSKLSRVYDDQIEIKTFTGGSALRRKLTKCNDIPIVTISSGLPLKGDDKVINFDGIKSEKALRTTIARNLAKEYHPGTKPSIDFIFKILEDAYTSGMCYDVSDLQNEVFAFAANSTNKADYCIKMVNKMHFKSEEPNLPLPDDSEGALVFYDVEVFPNLLLVNWKYQGEGNPVVRMINPSPTDIEGLLRLKLVGFNNRDYDNHILYGRLMGYDNEQIYNLSQRLVSKDRDISRKAKFGEAYNLSYTDVYDFSNTKQSLKKWEIELGIHHQELGLPWDQPVPQERWTEVAEYCDNDVIATEAVFNHLKADWTARQILSDLADMTVNTPTNSLTARIIFGNDRNPQSQFNHRFMGDMSDVVSEMPEKAKKLGCDPEYTLFDSKGRPIFKGYKYELGKSTYRGEEVGEGGFVEAEPGMHVMVALDDVGSMHPASIIAEELFGPVYTKRFADLRSARIAIKHEDYETIKNALNGKLAKYLTDEYGLEDLAYALKIPINMVYGQTCAKYPNAFRDPRNKDNIVAKRGALFMINLKHEVQRRGFTVAHIKTDSIKVPNATPEILEFISAYGELYGYEFEHEATYSKMCLVNDAVYIAQYATAEACESLYGYAPKENRKHPGEWTATGTQFAVPYVYKTLFTKEPIEFEDLCETKSVKSAIYLDMNENLPDVSEWEDLKKLRAKSTDKKFTKRELELLDIHSGVSDEELDAEIAKGHDYRFIGRVGQFSPVKAGCNGGLLMRDQEGSFQAVVGTKGYRWLESEMVRTLGKEADIDRSYYDKLVDEAVDTISKYGDFEWFVSDEPLYKPSVCDLPWVMPCGNEDISSCARCEHFNNDAYHLDCMLGYDISNVIINETNNE